MTNNDAYIVGGFIDQFKALVNLPEFDGFQEVGAIAETAEALGLALVNDPTPEFEVLVQLLLEVVELTKDLFTLFLHRQDIASAFDDGANWPSFYQSRIEQLDLIIIEIENKE